MAVCYRDFGAPILAMPYRSYEAWEFQWQPGTSWVWKSAAAGRPAR